MPKLKLLGELNAGNIRAVAVRCNGVDEARREERVRSDRLWFVLRGRFELRSARGRRAADPATVLLLRREELFTIRHPEECGDLCLSIAGALAEDAVDRGLPTAPLSVASFLRLRGVAERLARREPVDALELEETLCAALDSNGTAGASQANDRERRLANSVAHELALRVDEPLSLASLADPRGVSVFALCRAFRRVYDTTIHRAQQRLRLRHALALMLDTEGSLAEVAAECGFASHAHLTGLFRREFGLSPSVARREIGRPLLRELLETSTPDEMVTSRQRSRRRCSPKRNPSPARLARLS